MQRLLENSVSGLHLDIHLQAIQGKGAVNGEDFVLGEIVDTSARVGRLDPHLLSEELGGLVGLVINPAYAADMGLEKSDRGISVLLCPNRIDGNGVELIRGNQFQRIA